MPNCAVITCRARSQKVNLENGGISFHQFPAIPEIKKQWIDATGRDEKWFPTKTSTICSNHFFENDFIPCGKKRHLKLASVPSRNIVIKSTCSQSALQHKGITEVSASKVMESTENMVIDSASSSSNVPTQQKLCSIIEYKQSIIMQQRSKIRKLQARNRRLRKSVTKIVDSLKNIQQYLRHEEISTFSNTNLPT